MTDRIRDEEEPLACDKCDSAGTPCAFRAWSIKNVELHKKMVHSMCACAHQHAEHVYRGGRCDLCDCREFSKGVRIRDRINSVAGSMDDAHGRPFVLGRPFRLPRPGFACWPEDVTRVWLACVQKPDGTWWDDFAFSDAEVFEPHEERVPYDPTKPWIVTFDWVFKP